MSYLCLGCGNLIEKTKVVDYAYSTEAHPDGSETVLTVEVEVTPCCDSGFEMNPSLNNTPMTCRGPSCGHQHKGTEHLPKTHTELTENEVRDACAYWVSCGCPEVKDRTVYLSIHKGSNDPREPSGDYVTASVQADPK